jgi:hypothetical protein
LACIRWVVGILLWWQPTLNSCAPFTECDKGVAIVLSMPNCALPVEQVASYCAALVVSSNCPRDTLWYTSLPDLGSSVITRWT